MVPVEEGARLISALETIDMLKKPVLSITWILLTLAGTAAVSGQLVRQAGPVTPLRSQTSNRPVPVNYQLSELFPKQRFTLPVDAATPPGETNRLFIVERAGRIIEMNGLNDPARSVFLDITSEVVSDWENKKVEGLSSLAFHPDFKNNGYFFVTYTTVTTTSQGSGNHNRLSRFQVSPGDPHKVLPSSETPLLTQYDVGEGHNFNQCLFGPDGYLYMAVGDEGDGGNGDEYHNSQRIDKNFFSGVLRIDVDQQPGNLTPNFHPASAQNYSIPSDNPFIGATTFNDQPVDPSKVRTEFYAVGLRNPWRMSLDREMGWLMVGDVGQHSYEEIDRIVKGGNYGWSFREGTKVGPAGTPPDWFDLIGPVHQYVPGYAADQGYSVTGGVVYRGSRIPSLNGLYIFADFVSGNIWALDYDGQVERSCKRILSRKGIAGFALHPENGDVLLMDHDAGIIWKIDYASQNNTPPPTLSATGLFADTPHLTPAAGLMPYNVNVAQWSDNALHQRWFSLPDGQTILFSPTDNWGFPAGTIWVQNLEIDLTKGDSATRRRLETRLLIKDPEGVHGLSYKWNSDGQDAVLVGDQGADETISINDGGQIRSQVWHYPSRAECLACHSSASGFALGFNAAQLNKDVSNGLTSVNQLEAMSLAGFFNPRPARIHTLPALAPLSDTRVSREYRVFSYLAVNCSECHRPGTGLESLWDARITTSSSHKGLINGPLWQPQAHEPGMQVVAAGSLEFSELYERFSELGIEHMPLLASSVLDEQAISLVGDWIQQDLANYLGYEQWQQLWFGSTTDPAAQPFSDFDADGSVNQIEYLLHTNPKDAGDRWSARLQILGDVPHVRFNRTANRSFEVQFSDSLIPPVEWTAIDVTENRPFFSTSDLNGVVPDYNGIKKTRFYRLRIFEP